jgi:hypothetical protein
MLLDLLLAHLGDLLHLLPYGIRDLLLQIPDHRGKGVGDLLLQCLAETPRTLLFAAILLILLALILGLPVILRPSV